MIVLETQHQKSKALARLNKYLEFIKNEREDARDALIANTIGKISCRIGFLPRRIKNDSEAIAHCSVTDMGFSEMDSVDHLHAGKKFRIEMLIKEIEYSLTTGENVVVDKSELLTW